MNTSETIAMKCNSSPTGTLDILFESSTINSIDLHSMTKAKKVTDYFENDWDDHTLRISKICVYHIVWFGKPQEGVYDPDCLGFVYMQIFSTLKGILGADGNERPVPGIVFFRGDSVSLDIDLKVVDDKGQTVDEYSLFVYQPRVPGGKRVYERVAGMVNGDGNVVGAVMDEAQQETGLSKPNISELKFLGVMYPSIGGTKEKISLYHWETTITLEKFQELSDKGKVYGLQGEDEYITLCLVPKKDVKKFIVECGDAKAGYAMFLRMFQEENSSLQG